MEHCSVELNKSNLQIGHTSFVTFSIQLEAKDMGEGEYPKYFRIFQISTRWSRKWYERQNIPSQQGASSGDSQRPGINIVGNTKLEPFSIQWNIQWKVYVT